LADVRTGRANELTDIATGGSGGTMQKTDMLDIAYSGKMVTEYDARRFAGSKNAYLERARAAAMLAGVGRHDYGRSILDVGCGTCRGLAIMQNAGFTRLRGLELSSEMIAAGRHKLSPSTRVDRGSAFQLPYADESFDVVTSWNFVHMFRLERQQALIAEMARVCRPGGRVVVELDSYHKGFVANIAEQRRKRASTKFTTIWEMPGLFPRELFASVRVRGGDLPGLYRLLHRVPNVGQVVERLAFVPPFNWLAGRIAVCARKP
jgi:ubiquinone/menaquinone biosynthesis C-methylase UbiE